MIKDRNRLLFITWEEIKNVFLVFFLGNGKYERKNKKEYETIWCCLKTFFHNAVWSYRGIPTNVFGFTNDTMIDYRMMLDFPELSFVKKNY